MQREIKFRVWDKKKLDNTKRYRKTQKGFITNLYHKLKHRNKVDFDLDFLRSFSECKKFKRIFSEWEKSNYQTNKKPSIDRISRKKGYETTNIQWLTWEENRFKQRMELKGLRAKKVGRFLNGNLIETYKSQREAIAKFNISQSNLSSCLNGMRKTAKGFEWKYLEHSVKNKPKHIRKCVLCQQEFVTYSRKRKFCSRKCGATNNKNATFTKTLSC